MPADFLTVGAIEFYVRKRQTSSFTYLGTCTTAPEIEIRRFYDDLHSDKAGRAPWQKTQQSEQHLVTATLNRLNVETYNSIRNLSTGFPTHKPTIGKLVLNSSDFELFVRNSLYFEAGVAVPPGMWKGRLYKSAVLVADRESSDSRLKEITVVLECNPLYYKAAKEFVMFTEVPSELPNVTPE